MRRYAHRAVFQIFTSYPPLSNPLFTELFSPILLSMKNLLFLWLLALLTLPAWVQAQKITVTGRVLDGRGPAGLDGAGARHHKRHFFGH